MQVLREANPGAEEGGAHTVTSRAKSQIPTPEAIREQLERLLASPRFVSSPRCQKLLRYIVEETIRGSAESLKERNLGIEVFKRDAAYDTNANPVVRVAAGEVRKKLAQYYFEPGSQGQIRIEIPVGSYVPEFSFPDPGPGNETVVPPAEALQPHILEDRTPTAPVVVPAVTVLPRIWPRTRAVKLVVLAFGLLAICIGALVWRAVNAESPLERFWAPVLRSPNPVFLCTGQLRALRIQLDPMASRNPGATAMPFGQQDGDTLNIPVAVLNDSTTLANIAGLLRSERKQFLARSEGNTSYDDMQKGPVVLIGGLNNDWTIHMMRNMRFRFNQDPQTKEWWIADEKNPGLKLGAKRAIPGAPLSQDMAIVARILDSETKQPAFIVAGLTSEGTLAAGNFVTTSQYMGDYLKSAPRNWQKKNLEILLSVNVIDGQPGPPRVVDSTTW